METPALASMLEAKIKIKIEQLERLEREANILRIDLSNDIKMMEQISKYAREYGFVRDDS